MEPKRRKTPTYTDEDKAVFCELAQEIGIGRAIRELGYPTYGAGAAWMSQRGVEPNVDKTMALMKSYHTYYQVEDMLLTIDNAMAVAEEMLLSANTPDDLKRIADSIKSIVTTRQLIEGKATAINEKRETTPMDLEILDLINAENARNNLRDEEYAANPQSKEEI